MCRLAIAPRCSMEVVIFGRWSNPSKRGRWCLLEPWPLPLWDVLWAAEHLRPSSSSSSYLSTTLDCSNYLLSRWRRSNGGGGGAACAGAVRQAVAASPPPPALRCVRTSRCGLNSQSVGYKINSAPQSHSIIAHCSSEHIHCTRCGICCCCFSNCVARVQCHCALLRLLFARLLHVIDDVAGGGSSAALEVLRHEHDAANR